MTQVGIMHTLCMSPSGHIYWKPISKKLEDSQSPYYVTNIMQVEHPEIQASPVTGCSLVTLKDGQHHRNCNSFD